MTDDGSELYAYVFARARSGFFLTGTILNQGGLALFVCPLFVLALNPVLQGGPYPVPSWPDALANTGFVIGVIGEWIAYLADRDVRRDLGYKGRGPVRWAFPWASEATRKARRVTQCAHRDARHEVPWVHRLIATAQQVISTSVSLSIVVACVAALF